MRRGFTLVEMLVVLVLLGLAAALVAPAFVPTRARQTRELVELIGATRDAAVRRGEVVSLHVERSGAWQVEGGAVVGLAPRPPPAPFPLFVLPLASSRVDLPAVAASQAT